MRLRSDYSNEASRTQILSTLKAPREVEGPEDKPTDLVQKTITSISSPDRALSKHELCSLRPQ